MAKSDIVREVKSTLPANAARATQFATLPPATTVANNVSPKPSTAQAATASTRRPATSARLEPDLEYLAAAFLARTAKLASAEVVAAVPRDIAATDKAPAVKIP